MSNDLIATDRRGHGPTRASITPATDGAKSGTAVEAALAGLDDGDTCASPNPIGAGGWRVNQWLKQAVLLSFRLNDNAAMDGGQGAMNHWDKVPLKWAGWGREPLRRRGLSRRTGQHRPARGVYRAGRRPDAELRQHRRVRVGEGSDDRRVGDGRQSCAQIGAGRPHLGRRGDRRGARTAPGRARW